jgi:hypothetical protein
MLRAQKRHQAPCTRPEWDQRSCAGKGANCPVLIIGTLKGERVRLSTARFLPPDKARDMEAARDLAILWEKVGTPELRRRGLTYQYRGHSRGEMRVSGFEKRNQRFRAVRSQRKRNSAKRNAIDAIIASPIVPKATTGRIAFAVPSGV